MKKFVILGAEQRDRIKQHADIAELGMECVFRWPKKSREQEELYHVLFDVAAKQCRHLNKQLDEECWKRLLVDQFRSDMLADPQCHDEIRADLAEAVRMIPSLDGTSIVAVGVQTRKLRKRTASALIEWLHAFLANQGVQI